MTTDHDFETVDRYLRAPTPWAEDALAALGRIRKAYDEARAVVQPSRRWLDIWEEPCPYCAVWMGPHRHALNPDGTLGVWVEELR